MTAALIKWLLAVFAGVGAVAFALRVAGVGLDWVRDHLVALVCAAYAVAILTVYAAEKPPTPPPGPGPGPSPSGTNTIHVIRVGVRADGTIMPYGAPIREIK